VQQQDSRTELPTGPLFLSSLHQHAKITKCSRVRGINKITHAYFSLLTGKTGQLGMEKLESGKVAG